MTLLEPTLFILSQEYDRPCRDEAGVFWSYVYVVSDDGKSVWVRYADRIGNSFSVPRADLRPAAQTATTPV
jgi:hypothetical protein